MTLKELLKAVGDQKVYAVVLQEDLNDFFEKQEGKKEFEDRVESSFDALIGEIQLDIFTEAYNKIKEVKSDKGSGEPVKKCDQST